MVLQEKTKISIISALHDLGNNEFVDKPFRVKQIANAIFTKRVFDFKQISNIPLNLREFLSQNYYVLDTIPISKLESKDGTVKFLFELTDQNCVEAVYLKDKNNRVTFCISSQVGCRMGCKFCKTGLMGLTRNLFHSEIISQILYLLSFMDSDKSVLDTKFNIVFMGMGEPLDNYDELLKSLEIITSKEYLDLAQNRITISTCGIIDKVLDLHKKFDKLKIAVSLVSANNDKRKEIMPITNKFDIEAVYTNLFDNFKKYKNRITLEYVLIKNFNMGDDDIKYLAKFNNEAFHINLIPLNHSDDNLERPSETDIKVFQSKLEKSGFCVTRRYRRGDDIKADCGQLYWDIKKNQK